LILSTTLSETFPILRKVQLDVIKNKHTLTSKYPLFLSDFNETEFSRHIFEKCSNIKFNENTFIGSRVVQCGRAVGMTRLIVAFRNFVKAPKNKVSFRKIRVNSV
jgi:hypothetical protein